MKDSLSCQILLHLQPSGFVELFLLTLKTMTLYNMYFFPPNLPPPTNLSVSTSNTTLITLSTPLEQKPGVWVLVPCKWKGNINSMKYQCSLKCQTQNYRSTGKIGIFLTPNCKNEYCPRGGHEWFCRRRWTGRFPSNPGPPFQNNNNNNNNNNYYYYY